MKKLFLSFTFITALAIGAFAAEHTHITEHPQQMNWPFEGVFGTVDRQAAQRGFQVYKEVCAACHSLNLLSYRNLEALGFSKEEIKELAASYTIKDGPDDNGEMFERPGRPSDNFTSTYANEKAARAANNGAYPPDMSLLVKARHDGANYIHSILTGYGKQPPEGMELGAGMSYNPYFPGGQIAMPQPLSDGQVTFEDGTNATVDQMSKDLVIFLQWAAEPEMETRKAMGIKVMFFLVAFTVLFYVAKRKIWRDVK